MNNGINCFKRLRPTLSRTSGIDTRTTVFLRFGWNIIKRQLEIKSTASEKQSWNYKSLNKHVKAQLYKHSRKKNIKGYTKKELCPPVYIKTTDQCDSEKWQAWNASSGSFSELEQSFDEHFFWLQQPIRDFIHKYVSPIKGETLVTAHPHLKKHVLYWAILQDSDFQPSDVRLSDIGTTKVYVGKASRGIEDRWIKDSKSHCRQMMKCLHNVMSMSTYDPVKLKDIQLVQARLLLAKLRSEDKNEKTEETAIFLMKSYSGCQASKHLKCEERLHINGKDNDGNPIISAPSWRTNDMTYGMNGK